MLPVKYQTGKKASSLFPGLQKYVFGVLAVSAYFLVWSLCSGCTKKAAWYPQGNGGTPADSNTKRMLALGDSYTIGQSVDEAARFPNQAIAAINASAAKFKYPAEIIARTGWTTADLLSGITTANPQPVAPYDLVTLLIGVNNQYQGRDTAEYRQQFITCLDKALFYSGNRPQRVFLLSIPDYGYTPFGAGRTAQISAEIDRFNAINKQVALQKGITNYIDITPISRQGLAQPDFVAGDGLHPSGKQYAKWVEMMAPKMLEAAK